MLYPWKCTVCGKEKEVLRSVDSRDLPPEEECENCNCKKWERLITGGTGFILQGKGWFKKGGY